MMKIFLVLSLIVVHYNEVINGGSVYVRWGHRYCPSTSSMVYRGVAALPDHRSPGGGANQLCLPETPIYYNPRSGYGESRSFLYAVEYQTYEYETKAYHDMPCVVCETTSRDTQLMVPARTRCPSSSWTLEYYGYLMAERDHQKNHRSLHICVDRDMQIVPRTRGIATGHFRGLMSFVEARCVSYGGGLPCGPYVDGYELTCAVCTK